MKTNAVEVALTNADKVSNDNQLTSDVSSVTAQKGLAIANSKNKLYMSTEEPPADDLTSYTDGDKWNVVNDEGIVVEMFSFDGTTWVKTQWDAETLAVKSLSALSANLGNVTAGNLTSVNIVASTMSSGDGGFTISTSDNSGGSLSVASKGTVVPAHSDGTAVPYTETYNLDKDGIHEEYTQSTVDGAVKYDMSSWLKDGSLILKQGSGVPSADPYLEVGKDYIINYNGANLPTIKAPRITLGNIDINSYHTISSLDAGTLYFMDSDTSGSPISIQAKDFVKSSNLSKKTDISKAPQGYASDLIWGMDYRLFRYKADGKTLKYHLGGVIDDVNDKHKYRVPDEFMDENNTGISTSNQMAWQGLALQELMQRVSDLSLRVTKLELENAELKGE